jgi:hypothetical protein
MAAGYGDPRIEEKINGWISRIENDFGQVVASVAAFQAALTEWQNRPP